MQSGNKQYTTVFAIEFIFLYIKTFVTGRFYLTQKPERLDDTLAIMSTTQGIQLQRITFTSHFPK